MSMQALLDLSRLEVALGGDTALIGDILQMYADTAQVDLDALQAAIDQGDLDQGMRRAHSLKGSSANVGADAMADVAARIEKAARTGELEQAAALVPQLGSIFDATLAACRSHRAA